MSQSSPGPTPASRPSRRRDTEPTQIEIGMPVFAADGTSLGPLEAIDQRGISVAGQHIPMDAVDRFTPQGVYLARDVSVPRGATKRAAKTDDVRVPLTEERLNVATRPTAGEVELHKQADTVEKRLLVPVEHDEVTIERVRVDRQVEGPVSQHMDGEWLVIPVLEEVLVVEKRLMVTEEIRVRTRRVQEDQEVRGTVRRERVEVRNADATPGVRVNIVERDERNPETRREDARLDHPGSRVEDARLDHPGPRVEDARSEEPAPRVEGKRDRRADRGPSEAPPPRR